MTGTSGSGLTCRRGRVARGHLLAPVRASCACPWLPSSARRTRGGASPGIAQLQGLAAVAVASPPEKREAGTFGWRPGTCGP